jgi:hypothetical protein
MTQLTRLHSAMVAAGVWGAIIRQFFVDVYQAIDARLFNAIIERSDLCTSANGITHFPLAVWYVWLCCDSSVVHLLIAQSQASRSRRPSLTSPSGPTTRASWTPSPPSASLPVLWVPRSCARAQATHFVGLCLRRKQLAHITEVTSLLVLDMSVLSNEADVRDAFPTLSPKQLLHLASSFQSDSYAPFAFLFRFSFLVSRFVSFFVSCPGAARHLAFPGNSRLCVT